MDVYIYKLDLNVDAPVIEKSQLRFERVHMETRLYTGLGPTIIVYGIQNLILACSELCMSRLIM